MQGNWPLNNAADRYISLKITPEMARNLLEKWENHVWDDDELYDFSQQMIELIAFGLEIRDADDALGTTK